MRSHPPASPAKAPPPAPPAPPAAPDVVYIVDDDESVRRQIARLIRSAGMEPSCFASAEQFLARDDLRRPACLLLDMSMPGLDGLAVQDELQRRGLGMPIVFVSGHGSVPIATRAMRSGAVDFLEKPFQAAELLARVAEAVARDRAGCAGAAARADVARRYHTLTPREREVMAFVVRGSLNKQTAWELGISEKTVKIHRARVMEKMRADSVPALVHLAEQVPGAGAADAPGAVSAPRPA